MEINEEIKIDSEDKISKEILKGKKNKYEKYNF